MAGNYSFDQLKKAVASGEIDTVLACIVDMQGRLVGKRFQAEYFVDAAHDETHGCNYLLANDIDMEPVPGYKAASWAKGYGDFVMKPDLATLRRIPWLEGHGAGALRRARPPHHERPAAFAARHPEEAGQAADGAGLYRLFRLRARILSVRRDLRFRPQEATGRASTPHRPYIEDYHIFQTTKEEGVMRALRNGWRRPAFRSRTPRASGARARKRSTSAMPRRSTWPTATSILKNGAKEIAESEGKAITFMAKWQLRARRARPATSTSRCGAPTARAAVLRQEGRLDAVDARASNGRPGS